MSDKNWLPWQDLMAFGLGRLQLSPSQFWQMSLPEMDMAITGKHGRFKRHRPLLRNDFNALMASYPDT